MVFLPKTAGLLSSFVPIIASICLIFQSSGAPIRPGDSLTQISPTNVSRSYVGITEAGTRLFRISSRGDVEMSEDNGASWSDRSPGVLAPLEGITWTGNRLVAVGEDGLIITSDDLGLSWQSRPSNASGYYHAVAWTGTHLLATGVNGQTSQSADNGNTWDTYYFTSVGQMYGAGGTPGAWALVGSNGTILGSTDNGETWYEFYTTGPATPAFRDFVFTGSEYVIVGESGTILRSTNLTTWTPVVSGTSAHLQDLHWNGFQLFTVGGRMYSNHSEPETLLTSSDGGLTWSNRFSGDPGSLRAVGGGSTFLSAVGLSDLNIRSTDGGVNWTQSMSAQTDPSEYLSKIIDHHGVLVGIGGDYDAEPEKAVVSTSSDGGRTWSDQPIGAPREIFDIASAGNRLITVGSIGKVRTSDDSGSSWANRDIATSDWLTGVTHTGTASIAVGTIDTFASTAIYRSTDQGDSWDPITFSVPGFFYRATWTGTSLVAVGSGGLIAHSADDGLTWTQVPSGTTSRFNDVKSGPGHVLAAGESGTILRSTDGGLTWQPTSTTGLIGSVNHLQFDGTNWFALSSNGLATSIDGGLSWSVQPHYIAQNSSLLALQGSTLVLVNTFLEETYSSTDAGRSWKGLNIQTIRHINAFAKKGPLHLAVGNTSQLMTSTNRGDTWTIQTGPTRSRDLHDVICTEAGNFIAVGRLGEVITSPDGYSWSKSSFPNPSVDIYGISANSSTVVAVANDGNAYVSTNEGTTWTAHSTPAASGLYDVCFGNGEFLAVGGSGAILTSSNGQTWTPRSSGTGQLLWEAIWTGSRYIVAGGNSLSSGGGGIILTSTDAASWTTRLSDLSNPVRTLVNIGSRILGMGTDQIASSDDGGVSWSTTGTSILFINALHWDGHRLLVGCSNQNLWYSEGNAEGLAALGLAPNIRIRDASESILSNPATAVSFPATDLGSSSGPTTFTIENTGNATLLDLGILPSGTNPGDFPLNSGGASSFLDPGSSATFTVDFSPTESGARSASVQINSNDTNNPSFVIPLTGTGSEASPLSIFNAAAAAAGLTGPDALPDATPFGGSVTNLEKHAFNMNLSSPDSHSLTPGGNSGLPLLLVTPGGGDLQWSFSFIRRRDSGLIYTPQTSTTLAIGSFASMSGAESVVPIDDDWERVTIDETFMAPIAPSRFGRVDLELPSNP